MIENILCGIIYAILPFKKQGDIMNTEKENRPITELLLKMQTFELFAVLAIAYGVLYLFGLTGLLKIDGESWMNLFYLTEFAVAQWVVAVLVLCFTGSLSGKNAKRTLIKRLLVFLPSIIGVVFMILSLAVPGFLPSSKPNAANFFTALAVFIAGGAAGYLLCMGVRRLIRVISESVKRRRESDGKRKEKKERRRISVRAPFSIEADALKNGGSHHGNERRGEIFPDLLAIDEQYAAEPYMPEESADISLRQLCDGFNTYLESRKMYYTPDTIRSFIAGMACSRFLILEGLSGTGKTSLPKYFAEYTGCSACFTPVQASWKDRSDILGYYNDFTGSFKETPFLRALYTASYRKDDINLMVLDEMNLSRVEYYFADFLSVLELDPEDWKIELMPSSTKGKLPANFTDGCSVKILGNTWFIGTANRDDSTFTITDKVYDRAAIIDFSHRNESLGGVPEVNPIHLGSDELVALFREAVGTSDYNMSREDYEKFNRLGSFMLSRFEINFGNRVMNQIMTFVPVYVACGGSSAKAVDVMFSRKILRKLEGRFDDGLKADLVRLEDLIRELYGETEFSLTIEAIAKLKRKLI